MKKLIAMLGAVAMSFGLFADSYNISFESADESKGVNVSEMTFTPDGEQWTGATQALGAYDDTETGYAYGEGAFARRDNEFDDKVNKANYLKLETGKAAVTCAAGGNVFLDQVVKFTGFEEAPVLGATDKIAIWASEFPGATDDDQADVRLWVSCGKVANGETEQIDLPLNVANFTLDKWYRLTVKALGNVYESELVPARAGFIVYIDGVQVGSADPEAKTLTDMDTALTATAKGLMDNGMLFLSKAEDAAFTTVAYQGIGSVDDIILDQDGPQFAQMANVLPSALAITGAVLDKVFQGDKEIPLVGGFYTVSPGDIVASYTAAAGKILKGDPTATWTAAADGSVVAKGDPDFDVVDAAAQITRGTTVIYKAEDELYAAIAQVQDGDVVKFLKACAINDPTTSAKLYDFTPNTTITVAEHGVWTINSPSYAVESETLAGAVTDNVGAMPKKNIDLTFDSADGVLNLQGTLYGHYAPVPTVVEVKVGSVKIMGPLSIGDAYPEVGNDAGAELKAETITFNKPRGGEAPKITLVDAGKVTTKTSLTEENFILPDDTSLDIVELSDGWKTYQVKTVPPEVKGFKVILANGSEAGEFDAFADALAAVDNNGKIVLLKDLAVDASLVFAGKAVTLDLNSKTISVENTALEAPIIVKHGAALTIDDLSTDKLGAIDASNVMLAVKMTENGSDLCTDGSAHAVLVVNNGALTGLNYAISGNGNPGRGYTDITINGGTIVATDAGKDQLEKCSCAIYNPMEYSTLTINGGTITGYDSAVEIRAGELEITGGTLMAKNESYSVKGNGNGPTVTGAALAVSQHTTKKELGATVSKVTGATLTGTKAVAVVNPQLNTTDNVEVELGEATYNGTLAYEAEGNAAVKNNGSSLAAPAGYLWNEGVLVAAVAEVNGTYYATLPAAIAAADAEQTVTLLKSIELTARTVIDKAITLDLNNLALTYNGCSGIQIKAEGATVQNGTVTVNVADASDWDSAICFTEVGGFVKNMTVNAGNAKYGVVTEYDIGDYNDVTAVCENVDVTGSGVLFYAEAENMTLDANCSATQTGLSSAGLDYSDAVAAGWNGVLTIAGGTYVAEKNAVGTMSSPANITISGGTFTGAFNVVPVDPKYASMGDHNVTKHVDVTLAAPAGYAWSTPVENYQTLVKTFALTLTPGANATISSIPAATAEIPYGTAVTVTTAPETGFEFAQASYVGWEFDEEGKNLVSNFTMTAATEITGPDATPESTEVNVKFTAPEGATVTKVEVGGEEVQEEEDGSYNIAKDATATVTLVAGPGLYFANGTNTTTEDVTVTEKGTIPLTTPAPFEPVAMIGDKGYDTIPNAVAAAVDGDVIVVQKNVDCGYQVTMMKVTDGRKLTLDLNGFEVKASHDSYALNVSGAGSQITLQDSSDDGTGVLLKRGDAGTFTTIEQGGKLIINSGKIEYPFVNTMNIIRAQDGGIVEINGGEIIADKSDEEIAAAGKKVYVLRSNSGSVLTVNGGTIKGVVDDVSGAGTITIPADSTAIFDRDQTQFCVEDYVTDEHGENEEDLAGWWSVMAGPKYTISYVYPAGVELDNKASFATYDEDREFTLTAPEVEEGYSVAWSADNDGVTFDGNVMTIPADLAAGFTVTATLELDPALAEAVVIDGAKSTYYETVYEALKNATANSTVKVLKDAIYDNGTGRKWNGGATLVAASVKFTLDLNDHLVSAYTEGYRMLVLNEGADVTIIGGENGTGAFRETTYSGAFIRLGDGVKGGKLTLESGSIVANNTSWKGGTMICVLNGGTFVMNGGEIVAPGHENLYMFSVCNTKNDDLTTAIINGGTVKMGANRCLIDTESTGGHPDGIISIPADSTARFDYDWTDYCVSGYMTDDSQDGTAAPFFVGAKKAISYAYEPGTEPETDNKAAFAAYTDDRTFTLAAPTPEKDYDFTGWTTDATGVTFAGNVMTIEGDFGEAFTVTASYAAHTYNLTFGGAAPATTYTTESKFPIALPKAADDPDLGAFIGWTNGTITVAITSLAKPDVLADIALLPAYQKQTWPSDWPTDVDPAVQAKFADWKSTYKVTEVTVADEAAFLLNVDPKTTVPTLKIDSIAIDNAKSEATIVVSAGEKDLGEINGVLYVDVTDELGGEWASKAYDLKKEIGEDGKATFEVDITKGNFMKAKVGFKTPTK